MNPFRRARPQPTPAMRFVLARGTVHYPFAFFPWVRGTPEPPTVRAEIVGPTPESIDAAATTGELEELMLPDGSGVYAWHDVADSVELAVGPAGGDLVLRGIAGRDWTFENAVVHDWYTDDDWSADHPNTELCELHWDGGQHFLLVFLSMHLIVRSQCLRIA